MSSDKRSDILNATLNSISVHGFHGTPMSMIAEQADVGAGTIYRYFENKEDLINELFLDLKHEVSQVMLTGISPEANTEEIFRQAWLNIFNYCVQNPQKMLFLEQYENSPYLTAETDAATQEFLAPTLSLYHAAVNAGEIKKLPFELLTIFIHDVTFALAKRHISGTLEINDEELERVVQACWDAVKAS